MKRLRKGINSLGYTWEFYEDGEEILFDYCRPCGTGGGAILDGDERYNRMEAITLMMRDAKTESDLMGLEPRSLMG